MDELEKIESEVDINKELESLDVKAAVLGIEIMRTIYYDEYRKREKKEGLKRIPYSKLKKIITAQELGAAWAQIVNSNNTPSLSEVISNYDTDDPVKLLNYISSIRKALKAIKKDPLPYLKTIVKLSVILVTIHKNTYMVWEDIEHKGIVGDNRSKNASVIPDRKLRKIKARESYRKIETILKEYEGTQIQNNKIDKIIGKMKIPKIKDEKTIRDYRRLIIKDYQKKDTVKSNDFPCNIKTID